MFESATWTRANRRHFAVVERIYEDAGEQVGDGESWSSDSELAALACHRIGSVLLATSLAAGCMTGGKLSKRCERAHWKEVSPEDGSRASTFLTLATATMLSSEIESAVDPSWVEPLSSLIERSYSPPAEDLQLIASVKDRVIRERSSELVTEATQRGGTLAQAVVDISQAYLSFRALGMAGARPAQMPVFESIGDVDPDFWIEIQGFEWDLAVTSAFGTAWRDAKEGFLEFVGSP